MKPTSQVMQQVVAILGVVAAAIFALPSPLAAQSARTAPLTFFRGLAPDGAQIGVEIRDVSEADASEYAVNEVRVVKIESFGCACAAMLRALKVGQKLAFRTEQLPE